MSLNKILIVEDEMIAAMLLKATLSEAGYRICSLAVSSDQALTLAEAEKPDLVLMDIGIFGKKNGIETAKALQDAYQLPVIFMSGEWDEKMIRNANRVNHAGYLVKPIDIETLVALMEKAMGGPVLPPVAKRQGKVD